MKKTVLKIASVVFWLAVWLCLALLVNNSLLLPGPVAVVTRLLQMCTEGSFWLTLLTSLLRILAGTAAAVLLGVLLAVCTSVSKLCKILIEPMLNVVKATPVASFIILILLWIDRSIVPAVISALMVLPVVWSNVAKGIAETDKNILDMARVYRVPNGRIFRKIYVPYVMPYFEAALKASLGMGWKAGIAAEVLTVPVLSIGKMIYEAKLYTETIDLFAWTLAVILLSTAIEKSVMRLAGKRGAEK